MHITFRDRLLAALGTAIIVALLGTLLLLGLSVSFRTRIDAPMALLDLRTPPPPPPRPPIEHPKAKRPSGKASPANLRNKATPVVAPAPVVRLPPPPPPLVLAPKPGTGMAAQTGASDHPGPGTGAGGEGNGTGSGGSGDGDGDGIAPRQIKGRLKFADLPPDLLATVKASAREMTVAVRYQVEIDGNVTGCRATSSSGSAQLDAYTCTLIERRFRYKPSRDENGRPVRSTVVENHSWYYDRTDETPPGH